MRNVLNAAVPISTARAVFGIAMNAERNGDLSHGKHGSTQIIIYR
jgi:hypothetical protein